MVSFDIVDECNDLTFIGNVAVHRFAADCLRDGAGLRKRRVGHNHLESAFGMKSLAQRLADPGGSARHYDDLSGNSHSALPSAVWTAHRRSMYRSFQTS
jgi:hypothetical protein